MKRILLLIVLTLVGYGGYAQINQNSNPTVVDIGGPDIDGTGYIEATVANNGTDPMPPGTMRVYIGIDPDYLEFVDPSYIATEFPDWTVVSVTDGLLTLVNANTILPEYGTVTTFQIKVNGKQVGEANISLRVGIAPGRGSQAGNTDNSANDDNATGKVNIIKPLPVTLTIFTAVAETSQVHLRWSTTMETNSDRFEVERSAKGKDWLKIGVVKSHGESTVLRNYPFTDEVPLAGTNYYRLKMVDLDGSYEYSRMVSVEFTGDVAGVYPNPSTGRFRLNEKVLVGSIELTDASGYVIPAHRYQVGQDNHVEAESLPSGLYLLKVKQTNGTTTIHKLVIAR